MKFKTSFFVASTISSSSPKVLLFWEYEAIIKTIIIEGAQQKMIVCGLWQKVILHSTLGSSQTHHFGLLAKTDKWRGKRFFFLKGTDYYWKSNKYFYTVVFKMLSKNIIWDLFCVCGLMCAVVTQKGGCQNIISLILEFQAIIWFPKKEFCFYFITACLEPLQKYWELIFFSIASRTR